MTGQIYFQWQNPILRTTIYPVRDLKLQHFLLYYHEIDLWEKYKGPNGEGRDIRECLEEVRQYERAQRGAVAEAFECEKAARDYFIDNEDHKVAVAGEESQRLKDKLSRFFAEFRTNFAKYKQEADERSRNRKEKYYVAMRVMDWETYHKQLKQQITRKNNLLIDKNVDKEKLKKQLEDLNAVFLRVEQELNQLRIFAAALHRMEKRKQEWIERTQANEQKEKSILATRDTWQRKAAALEADQKRLTLSITRLTKPADLKALRAYFESGGVYKAIERFFEPSRVLIQGALIEAAVAAVREVLGDRYNSFHNDLLQKLDQWQERGNTAWTVQWIEEQMDRFADLPKKLDRVADAREKEARSLPEGSQPKSNLLNLINILSGAVIRGMIEAEREKLEDLLSTIAYSQKNEHVLGETLRREKQALEKIHGDLAAAREELAKCDRDLEPIREALNLKREKYLREYIPDRALTVKKDIVPFLARQYFEQLTRKDSDELLYEVFQRFWKEPERFPLWLQYMVVHFSGMRYASAHGSWADPRDLLLSFRNLDIQAELKNKNDGEIEMDAFRSVALYEPLTLEPIGSFESLPDSIRAAVGDANDNKFLARIKSYVNDLQSPRADKRRKALFELRVEEESCEIRAMKTEEVLDELREIHAQVKFPEDMWKEIVKLTDLRLTEVNSADWETFTPKDQEARLARTDAQMAKYRAILNAWKQKHLTGWREEHDESNRLIVTRAVCNEVAEHIQHLRGHKGAAGLAEKPFWYKGEETKYFEAKPRPEGPRPYFVRPRDENAFEVGASILWLSFVHEEPNQWRIARPIETRSGDGLISPEYLGRSKESGAWVYSLGGPITRTRIKPTPTVKKKGATKGGRGSEKQWLRWLHEATVATVAETAEDKVVLTFETNLPTDDPSRSTIGVVKRYLDDLIDDQGEDGYNATFVGFVPEKELPVEDLEEMLDWNHILLREVVTPAELEAYRQKYIRNRKAPRSTITIVDPQDKPEPVLAKLPWYKFMEETDKIVAADPERFRKVKVWGRIRPGELDVNVIDMTNFQAVGLFVPETGDFGAITNFIKIDRGDIDNLKAMQVHDVYEDMHADWRAQKMNWLCHHRGSIYMYDKKRDSWSRSPTIRWGTLALGGNLVQLDGWKDFQFKKNKPPVRLWRLAGFRKADWSRPLDDLLREGLVHRCFCAYEDNKFGDTPQGIVYSPFFNPFDWPFGDGKGKRARALYIPDEDLELKTEYIDSDKKKVKKLLSEWNAKHPDVPAG